MKSLFRSLKYSLLALVFLTSEMALAYTLGPNQLANIGSSGLTYTFSATSGPQAGRSYQISFNTGGTANFGNVSGGRFDVVSFNTALNSATIIEKVGGTDVNRSGSLSGSFNLNLSNVSYNAGANQAAAINGIGSGSATLTLNGTINGQTVSLNSGPLALSFMNFNIGNFGGTYDATVAAFGAPLNMGFSLDGNGNQAHAWTNGASQMFFNGVASNFLMAGDLHTSLSAGSTAVPEPATMGLLFSGLVGGAIRRRKKA